MSKIKITTIVGTRPELIRLSKIIEMFEANFEHRLVHTGQNSNESLRDVFFEELNLRPADQNLEFDFTSLARSLGDLFVGIESELTQHRPDGVVILGDTNSGLTSIIARRMGIPVYHLEAGNRSFDSNVPEEINRKIIDHTSDFNLVYSEHARRNLLSEGINPRQICLIGSPMREVIDANASRINESSILSRLGLNEGEFLLFSAHRQENINEKVRLNALLASMNEVAQTFQLRIIVTSHPRMATKIKNASTFIDPLIEFHEPFGFLDYCKLQKSALLTISDSGSISEESAILGFPAITIRDSMERPEALEAGSIVMSGIEKNRLLEVIELVETSKLSRVIPAEYQIPDTSTRVVNFLISTVHQHAFWNGLHQN